MLRKILTEHQVRLSSLVFFSGGFKSSFGVDHILFHRFKYLLMPVHLIIFHCSLFYCSGVLKIPQKMLEFILILSRSFGNAILFKPFNSTGAFSLVNRSKVFSFEWPLTHRSFFQDLTWLFLFSQRYSQILFQVWRKNELSSFKCLSPCSFKFFHRWFNLSIFHPGVPQQFGGVSHRYSQILKTEEEFLLNLAPFSAILP